MVENLPIPRKSFRKSFWRNKWIFGILRGFYYSFPVQLLLVHLKKNLALLLIWGILFGIVTGHIGNEFGIPYLFLDPEYLGKVNWLSLFIMGVSMGGFVLSFQITSYSLESNRFNFLGYLRRPFGKFFLNNSLIPVLFIVVYLINFIKFQTESEYLSVYRILLEALSFLGGFTFFILTFFYYLVGTNKDLFLVLGPAFAQSSERRRLRRLPVIPLEISEKAAKVLYYLEFPWKIKKVNTANGMNRETIQQVFAQNHLNAIVLEVALLFSILVMGSFAGSESIHIPAGASLLLFFTMLVMIAGWADYWLKEWTVSILLIVFIVFNLMTSILSRPDQGAAGLNYSAKPALYSIDRIRSLAADSLVRHDKLETLTILQHWRHKFIARPKLVLICCSGGGQRAAIWTIRNLQVADSLTGGELMNHAILMTGASGGMVGASFYRELALRKLMGNKIDLNNKAYIELMGHDYLNAIMFNFVVNDIFFRSLTFNYLQKSYYQDRGQALEEELNRSTSSMLNKTITAYKSPESSGIIPMMLLSPTVINDGRKLYISPQHISYMLGSDSLWQPSNIHHVQGIEFNRFFSGQGSEKLSFLSALRMSATFPYITPNIELPSKPAMEVMDAGMTDNYGIDDALKFAFAFRGWIRENTSGVIILSIRDAPSEKAIEKERGQTIVEKIISTIGGLYIVWEDIQNDYNDIAVSNARAWMGAPLDYLELPYIPDFNYGNTKSRDSISLKVVRGASLSWHLTRFEKENIQQSIMRPGNVQTLGRLKNLIKE